eukprot:Nitzschia sp. Nitz4//scaffold379_size13322//5353//7171//NITZ4_008978-RA/size13322-snap-gene-0.11-mRNA-1//1//CDS//3329549706//6435//frame0
MAESQQVRDQQEVKFEGDAAAAGDSSNKPTTEVEVVADGAVEDPSEALVDQAADAATTDMSSAVPDISSAVMERLARQVEYYFSTANLAKDTYVSTLRSLNDGYVPVSIIANFGKVTSLVPFDSFEAVRQAATEYSSLLEIVHIHTQTGRRLDDDKLDSHLQHLTVLAVGPVGRDPIPMEQIAAAAPSSPILPLPSSAAYYDGYWAPPATSLPPVQNTLIIREVPQGVEEAQIRDLFTFDNCPPIQSLHLDVANCWFVTLDTNSKDDMIHVMFELRAKTFPSGHPVLARLKSGITMHSDVSPPAYPYMMSEDPMMYMQPFDAALPPSNTQATTKKNSGKKKKKNGKSNGSNRRSRNGNGQQRRNQKSKKGKSDAKSLPEQPPAPPAQTAPAMGEDHFPALAEDPNSRKKVQVETVPQRQEKARRSSESGSTATTSDSSSASKPVPGAVPPPTMGGYAAALLKEAPPGKPAATPNNNSTTSNDEKSTKDNSNSNNNNSRNQKQQQQQVKKEQRPKAKSDTNQKSVAAKPTSQATTSTTTTSNPKASAWGRGPSFAEVLRKETGVAPGQSS